ncbi:MULTISPECIES: hypothetical protein [Agrobacterium]|uniref:hypothetical protein n=1 Tax=Agrobacterium TaxID=357 RepID=UPI0011C3506A|nr:MULTISPECIES: hypothetical protein [Agrobacterium]
MTKTLILGASSQIARRVVQDIAGDDGIGMTLFVRDAANPRVSAPVRLGLAGAVRRHTCV